MADTGKLAEVCAMLVEREQEFRSFTEVAVTPEEASREPMWPLSELANRLKINNPEAVKVAINRAKVAAGKAEIPIKEHFVDGSVFDRAGEVLLSKYAAYLFVINCDPELGMVGRAQVYFALQVDRQRLEDEKRLRTRLDVASEGHKLVGVAKDRGVENFGKFNGMGIQGLYGGLDASQVKAKKGLARSDNHLDYAGSEELAANLFRITQTRAALSRQGYKSESAACQTHKKVAEGVRAAIINAGNTPPEQLPASNLKIDQLATKTKRQLTSK